MTTIHAVELQAPGNTGVLILGVPGTVSAQKFIELGLYGDAVQYLAEFGYGDAIVSRVRVTRSEFTSFRGLGDGVALPRHDDTPTAREIKQEPFHVGGSYGRNYVERYNPWDEHDSGAYGHDGLYTSSAKAARELCAILNQAWREGLAGRNPHRHRAIEPYND